MRQKIVPNKNSLFFAPLEGQTDASYREVIHEHFPDWDYLCTDFLRLPVSGHFREKHFIDHLGKNIFENKNWLNKTVFQILTSERSQNESGASCAESLGLPWLDLNVGCPMKLVNSHFGGAYLLSDTKALIKILKIIRKNFTRTFSVKTRTGFEDTKNFTELIKIYEGEGVDLIFLHARTKKEFYHGKADWALIQKAVSLVKIPVIGNGDILNAEDARRMLGETQCHSVMVGRGALMNPWLAAHFKGKNIKRDYLSYIEELEKSFAKNISSEEALLKRLKGSASSIFRPHEDKSYLRSKTIQEFKDNIREMIS